MLEFNAESMDVFCQIFDAERMERILPASEIMCQNDSYSFFSPAFKTSQIIIDYILRKYSGTSNLWAGNEKQNMDKGLITCDEMQRGSSLCKDYITRFERINANRECKLKLGNVLAYYDDKYGTNSIYMLTKDQMISDYREDDGRYFDCQIKDIKIAKHGIYNLKGRCLVNGSSFSKAFMDLFHEIDLLGKKVEMVNGSHPLLDQGQETRGKYLEILIDKCFFDGYLTAAEVIRLEIMARQFSISSNRVKREMQSAIHRIKYKDKYLEWVIQKINDIPEKYHYTMIQDLMALEVECWPADYENRKMVSQFLQRVAERCRVEDGIVEKWFAVIQNYMQSSYNFRKMKEELKKKKNKDVKEKIDDSIKYEYRMQESMLRR